MAEINVLLDYPDGHEVIRDQIAAVLRTELDNQLVLAIADSQPAADWTIDVFVERSTPFDTWVESRPDQFPIVNIWYQSSDYDRDGSTVRAQRADGVFNIDIYGFGITEDDPGGGQKVGDKTAALEAARWTGIIRRILMSGQYTYLGSPRKAEQYCFGRWVNSITVFEPQIETRKAIHCVAARIALAVHFKVDSPQVTGQEIEIVDVVVKRDGDDRVLAEWRQDDTP